MQDTVDSIDPCRSLASYIGNKGGDFLSERDKNIKAQFGVKLREIQKFACPHCKPDFEGYILDCGEALLLINRQFGFRWSTIPYGEMETIRDWLVKNHHHRLQLLDKDYHYTIMALENSPDAAEYQEWFNQHEKLACAM